MAQQRFRTGAVTPVLMFCALMAFTGHSGAQDTVPGTNTSPTGPAATAPETIEVEAPRLLKVPYQPTNGTLQKVTLEGPVSYADLNLRTDEGVAELRSRIANEAADICAHLAQVYPVYAAAGTSCVKDAIADATIRANRAVTQARQQTY